MSIAATLRQRAALIRAFGHRPPRIVRNVPPKPARFPSGVRTAYLRELLAVVSAMRDAIDRIVVPELPRLVELFARGQLHVDSRLDALDTPRLLETIAIIGGPRTGKTTAAARLAEASGMSVYSSDDLISLGWSQASDAVAEQIKEARAHFGGVFEGVAVVRALRKLLKQSPERPVDAVIVLLDPHVDLTDGQRTMAEGTRTIVREVLGPLMARGVDVTYSLAEHLERPQYARLAGARARLDALRVWRVDSARTDADPSDPLGDLFDQVANEVDQAVPAARIAQAAGNAGNRIASHVRAEVDGQIKQVVGIDVFGGDQGLTDHVNTFVRQQLVQVQALTSATLNKVHAAVFDGLRQGLRAEPLAAKLRQEVGLSKTRATIIANDQVGKLNGELTRLRQTNLGISRYKWITARDELVRPGHRALDGTVQSWASPPVVNIKTGKRAHPGFDTHFYPCRCSAQPIIEDLLAGIDDEGLIAPNVPSKPPANLLPEPVAPAPAKRARAPKPEPLPPTHTPEHHLPALAPIYGTAAPQVAWGRAMSARGESLAMTDFRKGAKALAKAGIEVDDLHGLMFLRDLERDGHTTVGALIRAIESDPSSNEVRRGIARELRVTSKLIAHQRAMKGLTRKVELTGPVRVTTPHMPRARIVDARRRAAQIYSSMAHRDLAQPTEYEWISNHERRGECDAVKRTINVGGAKTNVTDAKLVQTSLHEMAHAIEALNPSRMANAKAYIDARARGESLQKLSDIFPHGTYDAWEQARPDKLWNPYMGKEYVNRGVHYATEATSMAVERIGNVTDLTNEVQLNDPDTIDWLLGQLANQ